MLEKVNPILCLPGLFAGGWIWEPVAVELRSRGFRVESMQNPLIACLNYDMTVEGFRLMVDDTLQNLAVKKAILLGNSLGGLVALDYATCRPDRVDRVVAGGVPGLSERPILKIEQPTTRLNKAQVRKLGEAIFYEKTRLTDTMVDDTYAILAERRYLLNMVRALKAIRNYSVQNILSSIVCPTLLLWGEHDQITPIAPWKEESSLLKDGRLESINATGHSPMIELPKAFLERALPFLGA